MSSNPESFAGYCCRLVRADHPETQSESQTTSQPRLGYGTIVKISGLKSVPLNGDQLLQQFPGLTLRVNDIPTEYALVATHSLISKCSDINITHC